MNIPKVSVIIITYRRPHFLKVAITSVLKQTYQDFEIIVVDDASGDMTESVVGEFNDDRIKYFCNQQNKGEGGSRNAGLEQASGKYIAFLDDDDTWESEKLNMQVQVLEISPEHVGAVYTGRASVDLETGAVTEVRLPSKEGKIYDDLVVHNFIDPSSILIERKYVEEIGIFDESLPGRLDQDMWIRIAEKTEFRSIGKPLVNYGIHPMQMHKRWDMQILGTERFLNKYSEWFNRNKQSHSFQLQRMGIMYLLNHDIENAIHTIKESGRVFPLNLKWKFIFYSILVFHSKFFYLMRVNSYFRYSMFKIKCYLG